MITRDTLELANFALKPSWFQNRDFIINKFKEEWLNLAWLQEQTFSEDLVKILYWENLNKDVFNAMSKYLIGQRTQIWVILDTNSHERLISITGDQTDWSECNPGTIRNLFSQKVIVDGIELIDNAIHRSKDSEQAYRDVSRMNKIAFWNNENLSNILNTNSPFFSFRNNISINNDWDIVKKYKRTDDFKNELQQISYVKEILNPTWIPNIKDTQIENAALTFSYWWRRLNQSWDPWMILRDRSIWIQLASILWSLHSTNHIQTISEHQISQNTLWNILKLAEQYWYTLPDTLAFSWIDFIGLKHWDFSLNNILNKKWDLTIIDWEFAWIWSQKIDIIKLFRTVLHDHTLTEEMINEYNKQIWFNKLSYDILIGFFLDLSIENLIKQDASWPKITESERKKYRDMLNVRCIENIKAILDNKDIKHVEF